jgi:hypothetical protein
MAPPLTEQSGEPPLVFDTLQLAHVVAVRLSVVT